MKEQERIAAILDKSDAIRRKRQQAIDLADEFLRSVFLEMFGDPATNPNCFNKGPVDDCLRRDRAGVQSGPFGSALKKSEYVDDGIPVWGVENVQLNQFVEETKLFITHDKFEQLERYSVEYGDVLISRAGTVGRMCIAEPTEEKSIISTNLIRVALDTNKLLPEYFVSLFTYFSHRLGGLKANQKDNAFTFLNPKTLKALSVPVPPLKEQIAYRAATRKLAGLKGKQKVALQIADDLFASTSQRAFAGEL